MEAGRQVPEDFASFVATQERRVRAASHGLTGNDRLAEALRRDLIAAIALRWWWFRLRPARSRPAARAAYLDRILRREARAWRTESTGPGWLAARSARSRAGTRSRARAGGIRVVEDEEVIETEAATQLARDAWDLAKQVRRRRRVVAAIAAALLGCVALVGPRPPSPAPGPDLLPPPPTVVPTGVLVLPAFARLAELDRRATRLPETINVDPTPAPPLLDQPLPRALAVLRQGLGPLVVVGGDGQTRRVDDPRLAAARLLTTSLSPDGTRIALTRANDLLVIDVTTGEVRSVTAGSVQPNPPSLVWHSRSAVLLPGRGAARQVDVDTGAMSDLAGTSGSNLVTTQGAAATRITELVSTSASNGLPTRIRYWRTGPTATPVAAQASGTPGATPPPSTSPSPSPSPSPAALPAPAGDVEDRPLFGPNWIGGWIDGAWSTQDTLASACGPGSILLPQGSGVARSAVVAVGANGLYLATLVAVETTTLDALGFVDSQTLLVAAGLPRTATVILAWTPRTGEIARVSTVSAHSQVAVADLLAPG